MRNISDESLKGAVDALMKRWEQGSVRKASRVREAWVKSVDDDILQKAAPVSLKKGVLTVAAINSSWLYRLTMEKRSLLEEFNKNYAPGKKAKDIRFRIGDNNL